jgi:hypothetical protein
LQVSFAEISLFEIRLGDIRICHDDPRKIISRSTGSRQLALSQIVKFVSGSVRLTDGTAVHGASGLVVVVYWREFELFSLSVGHGWKWGRKKGKPYKG